MHITTELAYPKQVGWFTKIRDWVNPYSPNIKSGHFWIIQGLVIAITVLHVLVARRVIFSSINCSDFFPQLCFLCR